MHIKPEPYTEGNKAYLTYDIQPATKARLLKEIIQFKYQIYLDGKCIHELYKLSSKLHAALVDNGFRIKKSRKVIYVGIDSFDISVGKLEGTKIPVIVRQLNYHGVKQIRVRITAETHDDLMDKTYAIRDTLSASDLKHKLCVWDRIGTI